jgi:phage gp37-like protein
VALPIPLSADRNGSHWIVRSNAFLLNGNRRLHVIQQERIAVYGVQFFAAKDRRLGGGRFLSSTAAATFSTWVKTLRLPVDNRRRDQAPYLCPLAGGACYLGRLLLD